ncbi:MAG: hypothetical protein VX672_08180, partial [Planctomycetota bacterium]|nr:hypothetical protein [Planctomycetota bacterium]
MSTDAATSSTSDAGSEEPDTPVRPSDDLRSRYEAITTRIANAARRAGRRPEDVLLVAVTKNASMDVVRELLALGHQD